MGLTAAEEAQAPPLAKSALAQGADFALEAVECACGPSAWSAPEPAERYGIVFVRRGCFHRRTNGRECFVDPTVVYFERPGDEQQIAHPGGGDSCTVLYLSEGLLASLSGGEPLLPEEPVASRAGTDLGHRLLLASVAAGGDADVADAAVAIAAAVLEEPAPARVAAGRPRTAAERRRVVAEARELLVERPGASVFELSHQVAVSPHHLSRVFRAETGETVSRYRNRLRVRLALERIADGETCLARLAADLGFSDQAHLSRVVRNEVGFPPSSLRTRLTRV
jgi:AraC-like DNA-binding protein